MIDWQAIDTVLLDMDGTLLDLHFDNYFWLTHLPQRYAEHHGLDYDSARVALTARIVALQGTLQWYCLDHWSELVAMDITSLKREIQHKIRVRPHVESFLLFLRKSQKKIILTTNAHRKGLELKFSVSRIDRYMDLVVSSHDYQQPKEHSAFWQSLHQKERFDADRTLFIDDNIDVLRAAQAFGISHLVCVTQPDLYKPACPSDEFVDIVNFDELMPRDLSGCVSW